MIGMRSSAVPIRSMIESALSEGDDVTVNFEGVEVTQSFVDELIGAVILRQGPEVLNRLVLKGCSQATKSILKFVASDRSSQFAAISN